jgi:hypothetical protein
MKKNKLEWKCRRCDEICFKEDILTAPNPFEPKITLVACPSCKEIDNLQPLCDEQGCIDVFTNVLPARQGQRRVCDAHLIALKQPSGNTG